MAAADNQKHGSSLRAMLSRRRRWLTAVVAVLALVLIAGVVAWRLDSGGNDDKGESADADITALIEQRALTATLTLPGSYHLDDPVEVQAPVAGDGTRQVVTKALAAPGDAVTAGSAVVEINYRPVMLVQAALPLFRDIRPAMTGADVANVQEGLRQMGWAIPDEEMGTFGAASQTAVREMYQAAGYEPDYTDGSAAGTDAMVAAAHAEAEAAYQVANTAQRNGEDATELIAAYHAAEDNAEEVERTSGVMLTLSGLATAPQGSLKVGSVATAPGRTVSAGDVLVVLSAGDVVLLATVTPRQATMMTSNMAKVVAPSEKCLIGAPAEAAPVTPTDEPTEGTDIAEGDGDGQVDGGIGGPGGSGTIGEATLRAPVICLPTPSIELVGTDAVVTVSVEVAGADSLVVPATALVYEPDGSAAVIVVERGVQERTPVTVVGEADGFVAIQADSPLVGAEAHVVVTA